MAKSAPSKKYPKGPVKQHHLLATGDSLAESQTEARIGGSKNDKSNKTNK